MWPATGASFRFEIKDRLVQRLADLDVVEVMVDHYLAADVEHREWLRELAREVPVLAHGVGLSLGTCGHPDERYLERVAAAISDLDCRYYSEHLAFTRASGVELGELLPLPRTQEVVDQVVKNIEVVKSFVDVPFYLENIAYYFEYRDSYLSEQEFLAQVCQATQTGVLLDVENLHANFLNHGVDPRQVVEGLPAGIVKAIHVGGGEWRNGTFLDDHGHAVPEEVFGILQAAARRHQPETVIVEWDQNLGDGSGLLEDVRRVRACLRGELVRAHGG